MRLGRIVRAVEEFGKRVGVVRAYHGSGVVVREIDRGKTVDGTFWFSEDIGKIERGESGAAGVRWIMEVELDVGKVAGWEEYDRYMLDQIEDMGYNSVKLDDDWIMFDPERIRVVGVRLVR